MWHNAEWLPLERAAYSYNKTWVEWLNLEPFQLDSILVGWIVYSGYIPADSILWVFLGLSAQSTSMINQK
jgi:hypothetical protein